MANINLLDTQTANLIAAGEVVERPANVLKELLENAIDAKSSVIVTEIEGGGVDLIRVTDNGCGMDKEDLPLSIRRHATSKIRSASDLSAISTLGFRGEALAAISSTSRFTLLSKRSEAPVGHQMSVEGEEILSLEECGSADGTTVIVRDLFFNTPARRKFLKSARTESSAILQYIQRIAVSHPEIAFRHISDGQTKLQTPGNGKLLDCIYSVYGKEFAASLIPLDKTEGSLRIHGFLTRPEMARNNHSYQSFYINSRYVKSRTMSFALEDAYKSFVKSEKFPGCVLFLELDPKEVDVNVHPAKLEVRFSDERSVYNTVYHAVREALTSLSNRLAKENYELALERAKVHPETPIPSIHEKKSPITVSPSVAKDLFAKAKTDLPLFSPAPSRGKSPLVPSEEKPEMRPLSVEPTVFLEETTKRESKNVAESETAEPEQLSMDATFAEKKELHPLFQEGVVRGVLFHAFILYETRDTVYLIDKHAAHERILYEKLKARHKNEGIQMLLEPLLLTLSAMDAAIFTEHRKELEDAGFLVEEFGENSFLVRGIPLEILSLSGEDILSLLRESAREMALGGKAAGAKEKRFDRTLYSMACKAAVKAGIPSSGEDHDWIVEKLKEIDNITVCPHGRPVLVSYTKKQIENLFLRS